MAAGLAAFLLLDRRDRVGDVGAAVALGVAVACSGVGLPFVGAITVELLVRRRTWRRLWVPLVPLALWGVWYLQYGQSQVKASNIDLVPDNAARMGAAAIGALAGTALDNGRYLLGALAAVVIVVLAVERRISPRFAAVLVLPLGYWLLTALSRAQYNEPDASRYLYPGAIFVVLVLVGAHPAAAGPRRTRRRDRVRSRPARRPRVLGARERRTAARRRRGAARHVDVRQGGAARGRARARSGRRRVSSRPDTRAAGRRGWLPRRGRRPRFARRQPARASTRVRPGPERRRRGAPGCARRASSPPRPTPTADCAVVAPRADGTVAGPRAVSVGRRRVDDVAGCRVRSRARAARCDDADRDGGGRGSTRALHLRADRGRTVGACSSTSAGPIRVCPTG